MVRRISGYGVGSATIQLAPVPVESLSLPTSSTAYDFGQLIFDKANSVWYLYSSGTTFLPVAAGSSAILTTLTGNSGGAISPTAGNINILGTTNQFSFAGSGSTLTGSLSATLVAPGSIASTTTLTSGTSLSATTSITSGTTITATLGAITATNGNLVLGTAGNKISIATGSNATVGISGSMVAGAVTVSNTSVTDNSKIFAYPAALGTVTAPQAYYISAIVPATSFTIASASASDTSTWNYWFLN